MEIRSFQNPTKLDRLKFCVATATISTLAAGGLAAIGSGFRYYAQVQDTEHGSPQEVAYREAGRLNTLIGFAGSSAAIVGAGILTMAVDNARYNLEDNQAQQHELQPTDPTISPAGTDKPPAQPITSLEDAMALAYDGDRTVRTDLLSDAMRTAYHEETAQQFRGNHYSTEAAA